MARTRKWPYVLLGLGVLAGGAILAIDPLVARALRHVAAKAAGTDHHVTIDEVDVSLFDRHLRVYGLSVTPVADSLSAKRARFTLEAKEIQLNDVDLRTLVREEVLHLRTIRIIEPSVFHSFATERRTALPDTLPPAQADTNQAPPGHNTLIGMPGSLALIQLDSLSVERASFLSEDLAGVRPSMMVEELDLFLRTIVMRVGPDGALLVERDHTELFLRNIHADLPPLYTFGIDSLRVVHPEDITRIFGIHVSPKYGPKQYYAHVEHMTSMYRVHADSLVTQGLDLMRELQDGSFHAGNISLYGALIDVHLDKSVKEGPFKRKPLPAEAVLGIPVDLSVDTLRIIDGEAHYSERIERKDDYGTISFTEIQAVLTGLNNVPRWKPTDMHLAGTANLAGYGNAELDLRMPMDSDEGEVHITASMDRLKASALNSMTDDLVKIEATSGVIHKLRLKMDGDDQSASGTVDMEYEDLQLQLNNSVQHAKLISTLANMVVKGKNLRTAGNYRQGTFNVKRRQDRSVFNYLWLCVREGAMESVLPPAVTRTIRARKAKETAAK